MPDALAVLMALAASKILTMYVAEAIVVLVFAVLPVDSSSDSPLLLSDLVLSFGFDYLGLWLAWRWSRSRSFTVPLAVAALSVVTTLIHRWFMNDFGWPLWYELALLTLAPVGLVVFRYFNFRSRFRHLHYGA
jgi:hypothetical protein